MRKALQYFLIATMLLLSFAAIAQKGEIVYQKGAFLKQLQELFEVYGLTAENIVKKCKEAISMK